MRQKTALVLHYEGFSNAEAAEILEISVSALEALLVRARRTCANVWPHDQGRRSPMLLSASNVISRPLGPIPGAGRRSATKSGAGIVLPLLHALTPNAPRPNTSTVCSIWKIRLRKIGRAYLPTGPCPAASQTATKCRPMSSCGRSPRTGPASQASASHSSWVASLDGTAAESTPRLPKTGSTRRP